MPKQHKQSDENEIAFALVNRSTGNETRSVISAYMAEIGSRGGAIGGKRRLKTMTKEQRSRVARKAARARWKS